jgi:hypothetical protein
MIKNISFFITVSLFTTALVAQENSRSVSSAGTIVKIKESNWDYQADPVSKLLEYPQETVGNKKNKIPPEGSVLKKEVLECTASFEEPSGDQILSEGETGTLVVKVVNWTDLTVSPVLNLTIRADWTNTPIVNNKTMSDIKPGETGYYRSKVSWNASMKEGEVNCDVKVEDMLTDASSQKVKASFRVAGSKQGTRLPELVDVDTGVAPTGQLNPDAIAVIIGNQDYSNKDVPKVDFAVNDAMSMKNYMINRLGFREANIIYLENASKTDFETLFGTREVNKGKLFNYVKPQRSDVFVYYSGHGAPDVQNNKAYFMPVNADPNYVKLTGYPLDVFYQNLAGIPSRSTTVILDACFSGGSAQGMLIKQASPMFIEVDQTVVSGANVLASASGTQISSWYPEGKHSLFTYYLLRGLRGEADMDKNREITVGEMRTYLDDQVTYTARRLFGREQNPVVKGEPAHVLCKY